MNSATAESALQAWAQQAAETLTRAWSTVVEWGTSVPFYAQLGAILAVVAVAWLIAALLRAKVPFWRHEPADGRFLITRRLLYRLRVLVFPALMIVLLGIAAAITADTVGQSWLVLIAEGLAVVLLLYNLAEQYIGDGLIRGLAIWIGIPLAILNVFGWLDDFTAYLDGLQLSGGNIRLSLLVLLRTLLFGAVLFWLGRISSTAGKQAIRNRKSLDVGTREVFAKLFEIGLFVVLFVLLLQVMGINLTALAVFGGALGVGLGFGLQQIASNFISGIIILLDRSITIGDYIEMEDGRQGMLRELNMRFAVLETFDGKDLMVPNEQFITTSYTNWTHKDPKQRYSLEFQVAYGTDLDLLFDNVREICRQHPHVLSGGEYGREIQPDAEISGFGDSGIDILVEYWIDGIDDGKLRVGADLLHSIWRSIEENGMEIPYPQREVRLLNPPQSE